MTTKEQQQQQQQQLNKLESEKNTKVEDPSSISPGTTSSVINQDTNRSNSDQTSIVGQALSSFSDIINQNLIIARYGTIATITLLTAYGLSQTPLFFRYKRVAEIPPLWFANRYTIHGRIVHIVDNNNGSIIHHHHHHANNQEIPVICLIRHSSPLERLFNRSTIEFFMKHNPSSRLQKDSRIEDAKDLLKVEIGML